MAPPIARRLVDHPGLGPLLVRSAEFGPVVLGRGGLRRIAAGVVIGEDPLALSGPDAVELVHRLDAFPHYPDVMINSRCDPPGTGRRRSSRTSARRG